MTNMQVEQVSISRRGVKLLGGRYDWPDAAGELPQRGEVLNLELAGKRIVGVTRDKDSGKIDPGGEDNRRELLIVRQTCLERAVDIIIAEKEPSTAAAVIEIARKFEEWVLR